MLVFYRIGFAVIFATMLVSCASTDKKVVDEIDETGNYKYSAWHLESMPELEAINILLDEADQLILNQSLNAATDKLERVLRIKPDYAPAWSRLSWLALQADTPERSIQMAKRSNSFAYSNPQLQRLNWSFIRSASEMLNDEGSYDFANQKIQSLRAF